MDTKLNPVCNHCKGARVEPGEANCTWCDDTGKACGLGPLRFTKGDTDPSGDCDKFEAGIHVGDWFQRIVVYGDSPADAEALRDEVLAALEGINPAEPAKCEHMYVHFGTEQLRRRCTWCNKLEPVEVKRDDA